MKISKIAETVATILTIAGVSYIVVKFGGNSEYSVHSDIYDDYEPCEIRADDECASAIKAIQFFKKEALERVYASDKLSLALKIWSVVENASVGTSYELIKSEAIAALADISDSLTFSSDKNRISGLIADIVEM